MGPHLGDTHVSKLHIQAVIEEHIQSLDVSMEYLS